MTTRVSVIVPCHDHGHLLGEALDSIAAQNLQGHDVELEVIVADDRSSDDTAAIATARGAKVVASDGPGASAARNAGVAASTGLVIGFLDADDVWMPNSLAVRLTALEAQPVDLVYGAIEEYFDPAYTGTATARPAALAPLSGSTLITRHAWDTVGGFDPGLIAGELADWLSRYDAAGLQKATVPDLVLRRRIHATNTTRNKAATHASLLTVARRHRDRKQT